MSKVLRFRGTGSSIGSSGPTEITFTEFLDPNTDTWVSRTPPIFGMFVRLAAELTAGASTTITEINLREGSAGNIRVQFQAETLDMDQAISPGPQPYQVTTPSDVIADIVTDDGGDASTINVIVDIEVD